MKSIGKNIMVEILNNKQFDTLIKRSLMSNFKCEFKI